MDFYQTWRSGKVNRMHSMPQLHRENVAEHTWGMLLAVCRFYPEASAEFLKAVILHDAGEIATGDVPAHIKWSSPELEQICEQKEQAWLVEAKLKFPALSAAETELLVVFDKLDFCMSCVHEMRLGNLNAARYYKRSYSKATLSISKLMLMPGAVKCCQVAEALSAELDRVRATYCQHVKEYEYDLAR